MMKLSTKARIDYDDNGDDVGYDVERLTGVLPYLKDKLLQLDYIGLGHAWEYPEEVQDLLRLVDSTAKLRIETDSRDGGYTLVTFELTYGTCYFVGAEPVGLRGLTDDTPLLDLYNLPIKWKVTRLTKQGPYESEDVFHNIPFSHKKAKTLIHAGIAALDLYGEQSYSAMHDALVAMAARAEQKREEEETHAAAVAKAAVTPAWYFKFGQYEAAKQTDVPKALTVPAPEPMGYRYIGKTDGPATFTFDQQPGQTPRVTVSTPVSATSRFPVENIWSRLAREEAERRQYETSKTVEDQLCPEYLGCLTCTEYRKLLDKF